LKKAAKRKEKQKTKSKATWYVPSIFEHEESQVTETASRDAKKDQVAAAMAARQKKREDNIAMRNERRKDKKKGGSKKARPGFEGKSFGRGKAKPSGKKKQT
jgi:hypothetical protein